MTDATERKQIAQTFVSELCNGKTKAGQAHYVPTKWARSDWLRLVGILVTICIFFGGGAAAVVAHQVALLEKADAETEAKTAEIDHRIVSIETLRYQEAANHVRYGHAGTNVQIEELGKQVDKMDRKLDSLLTMFSRTRQGGGSGAR
jgi:hypothetical protein